MNNPSFRKAALQLHEARLFIVSFKRSLFSLHNKRDFEERFFHAQNAYRRNLRNIFSLSCHFLLILFLISYACKYVK